MHIRKITLSSVEIHKRFTSFQNLHYFPELDGLRAISVLMVLAFHTGDILWTPIHGYLGVTIFFVISGFLITTLLLREEEMYGKISYRNFYIRRTFRIFPLYYIALLLFSILVLGLGLGADPEGFRDRLPLLTLYLGEFAGSGTFSHSWSLGIEEKFYIVWPILAFGFFSLRKYRINIALFCLIASIVSTPIEGWNYLAIYTPILSGCLLAILLHNQKLFKIINQITSPLPAIITGALIVGLILTNNEDGYTHVTFSLAMTLFLPSLVVGSESVKKILSWKPLTYVGTRAYGIYLFHPLVMAVVDKVLNEGSESIALQLLRLITISVFSIIVADVLYRIVEQPLIKLGRRLTVAGGKRSKSVQSTVNL
ncbi:acyltransferase family protein [Metabacillus litoralis]|uniref:acyltransferase family protein n=1 Tax=Metabacillus litoralis TaxID=152268 RepID=UPI00203E1821|nr:acyltransferase [Metabacillus litoralis]MCM3409935.1 acyltransferase [Metabacillus litoralis]